MRCCIYCGATEDLTDDRVPPKNLFPRPRPQSLITVLACRACNGWPAKDDEETRPFKVLLSTFGLPRQGSGVSSPDEKTKAHPTPCGPRKVLPGLGL